MTRKVEISHKTIIFTGFFVIFLWFLYFIRDILLQIFVSLLLVSILNPFINKMSIFKVPKIASVLIAYLFIFGILGTAFASIIPPLVEETSHLTNNLPTFFQSSKISTYLNEETARQFVSQLGSLPSQILKTGFSIFGNIFNILTVAVFALYMILSSDKLNSSLEFLFGKDKSKSIADNILLIEAKLGNWAIGQLSLMLSIGVLSYIGFVIIGIPYPLPLALLAGIFEIVPYVGPIIAAIPAIILGFSTSNFLGFASIILALLIQQIENYFLVPKIMEKSVGVAPIVTLLSLAIGFKIAGITGMIISIPIVLIIQILAFRPLESVKPDSVSR